MINIVLLSSQLVVDSLVWQIPLMCLCGFAICVFVFYIRFYIAYKMAKKRNRSTLGWSLFSIFISPIWAWILLALLGKYTPPDEE